jgi:hypothetical protein
MTTLSPPAIATSEAATEALCPSCGCPPRLEGGGCLTCYISVGLEEGQEIGADQLQAVLGELD